MPNPPVSRNKLDAADAEYSIASRISDGVGYRQIARAVGVSPTSLTEWIEAEPERSQACARARIAAAQMYDEMAEERVDMAGDAFELMKAKELAVHYRWRSKVANPAKYGEKLDIKQESTFKTMPDEQIDAEIRRIAEKLGLTVGASAVG